ncbi:MAG TPA: restriction endonuclease subunit S, partial [Caulobacteraceae bacterium]|nr:restriction endonuclease subunit S [Caulobacteraceae bacterium]
SRAGSVGKSFLITHAPKSVFASYLIRYRPIIDSKYVLYFLQSPYYWSRISEEAAGIALQNVNATKLDALILPVPPAEIQNRIVARIDALFDQIDDGETALAEARAGVETYRKALLKAAVTGELTADWRRDNPPAETGQDLLRRILAERKARWTTEPKVKKRDNDTANASDVGELVVLPASWAWIKVAQAGLVQLGRQRTPKDHCGPHMRPYLRVANVYEDRISTADVKQMNFTPSEFETFELKHGDILLNEGQSLELVGRPAIFRGEVSGCCFQNTLIRFVASPAVDCEYALLVFLDHLHSGRFQRIATITTNIAHLGASRLSDVEFPLPPLAEQREIVRRYRAYRNWTDELDLKPPIINQLRQSILSAAFRGELA